MDLFLTVVLGWICKDPLLLVKSKCFWEKSACCMGRKIYSTVRFDIFVVDDVCLVN